MAVGTGFDYAKYGPLVPAIWSPRLNRALEVNLAAAPFFWNLSDETKSGGDKIYIPNILNAFSASSIAVTSGDVTATAISTSTNTLSLDQWQGASFYMTKFEEREIGKSYNAQAEYVDKMGYALAKKIDQDLLNLTASLTPTAGSTTTQIVSTNIESAFGILDSNSVPKNELAFFIKPKVYWTNLMKIQKYYDASQFGKATVPKGAHDMLYGVPLIITTQCCGGGPSDGLGITNALVHRSAIVYAFGGNPADITIKESEHLRKKVIADVIYGKAIINATRGVRILSTSL